MTRATPAAHTAEGLRMAMRDLARNATVVEAVAEWELFHSSGDARHVWEAFLILHRAGEQIPPEIEAQFALWAERIRGAGSAADIQRALGLSGSKGAHSGQAIAEARRQRAEVWSEVDRLRRSRPKLKQDAAIRAAARNLRLPYPMAKKQFFACKRELQELQQKTAIHALHGAWK